MLKCRVKEGYRIFETVNVNEAWESCLSVYAGTTVNTLYKLVYLNSETVQFISGASMTRTYEKTKQVALKGSVNYIYQPSVR